MEEPVDVYANAVKVVGAAYDFTLEFSANLQIGPQTDPQHPSPIERRNICRVRMSPQHAKALIPILMDQVMQYEKQLGPVPLPPDMNQLWEKIFGKEK